MQNQMNLQRGDAVFFEGMCYYYSLGHPMIPTAQTLIGPTYRQHTTKTILPSAGSVSMRNPISTPSIWSVSNAPWIDPLLATIKAGE